MPKPDSVYFLLEVDDDGQVHLGATPKDLFIKKLNDGAINPKNILDHDPWNVELNAGPVGTLVIEGRIVKFKKVLAITKWEPIEEAEEAEEG